MRVLSTLLVGLVVWPTLPPAAPKPVEITEWTVPWEESRPRDPYVDSQGRVWFVGQRGNYVAYLEPKTGEFKRYELDERTLPHNLIVSRAGVVWYAGNAASHIGRLDPQTGRITKYPMPDPAVRDPHTLVFDRNGDIWFTAQGGNVIGKLAVASGEIRLVKASVERARPYGIKLDSRRRPWVALFGTNRIANVDPETMAIRDYALREEARPRRLEVTPDDAVWYVDYAGGRLGRLDPASGQTNEWITPSGERSRPYGTASDDQGRLWFVETGVQPNKFVGFDPKTEEFFSVTEVKSGGGTIRHMFYHREAQEIWFGTDANTIGRAKLP